MSLEDRLHAGEFVDLSDGPDDRDSAAEWGTRRQVSAELIASLLVRPPDRGDWNRPLRLEGARITGGLELDAATLTRPVVFERCSFEEMVVLLGCQAVSLIFLDCDLPRLLAEDLVTRGDLILAGSRIADGISVRDARIGGMVDLDRATVKPADGIAVQASRLSVGAEMTCGRGFTATGELRLIGARIAGNLNIGAGAISNPDGHVISGDGLEVGGVTSFDNAHLAGETRLVDAHLGGLDLSGGTFQNAGRAAILASGLVVTGSAIGRDGLRVNGQLDFTGASFGGGLDLDGAVVNNAGAVAISAQRIRVDGNLHLRYGFHADGEIRIGGAHISGQLDFAGATLQAPETAVNAYSAVIGGSVLCDNGFQAAGEVSLSSARIGGDLEISDSELRCPEGGAALELEQATVAGSVTFEPRVFEGALELGNARVGVWRDSDAVQPDRLNVNGFHYGAIDGMTVDRRLAWLQRDPAGYAPQPYHQLATVLRNHGQDAEARRVLIASEWLRRRRGRGGPLGWVGIASGVFLRATVGYGYRPWLVLAPWTALLVAGSLLFDHAHRSGTLTPAHASGTQPGFQSVRYTLDLLLPVANLQLRGAFIATSTTAWLATGFMLAGWLLALILVAALTGV
ncbi:MAG TPA: hypothetical protein VHX59_26600, partial [Mycobacteriales bacterium]|nr:hypothetical protein [Mycobacteriales bacterium]